MHAPPEVEKNSNHPTPFPEGRASVQDVQEMSEFVTNNPLFQAVLESVDGFLMILNPQRQIVAVNRQLLECLKLDLAECLKGDRPGEILGCIHADEGPQGCGTSKACESCGALISILTSQREDRPSVGECLATVKRNDHLEALEFRVRATPVHAGGHHFTVLIFTDISGDKRRQALERTFFHDILNTLGGLMGWSSLLKTLDDLDPKETATRILNLSYRLKQEIEDQRRLTQAEQGTLYIKMDEVPVKTVLDGLLAIFQAHDAAEGKHVDVIDIDAGEMITTDASLLLRVLTNMTKNALEAVKEDQTVRVWFERQGETPVFLVHNPGAIGEDVAQRIFQRSFSTKGQVGRGIGTYSMKLFGERYLGGKVEFTTSREGGTIFSIRLPLQPPKMDDEG